MTSTSSISNFRRMLVALKASIPWERYVRSATNHQVYGFKELVFLSVVLHALGCISWREKHACLCTLRKRGLLDQFYHFIGIAWQNPQRCRAHALTVPSLSTFVLALEAITDLTGLQNKLLAQLPDDFSQRVVQKGFLHLAIDGKVIRHSDSLRLPNQQHINAVAEGYCLLSFPATQEGAWAKACLPQMLLQVKQAAASPVLWTGDALYNTPTLRKASDAAGIFFVLPVKGNSALLKTCQNWARRRQALALTFTGCHQRKTAQIQDDCAWIPLGAAKNRYALRIQRTCSEHGVTTCETRWLITNLPCQNDLAHAQFVYAVNRQHWQVETYHQQKDVWFQEDRFQKTPRGAHQRVFLTHSAIRLLQLAQIPIRKHPMQQFWKTWLHDFITWVFCGLQCFLKENRNNNGRFRPLLQSLRSFFYAVPLVGKYPEHY